MNKTKLAIFLGGLLSLGASVLPAHAVELSEPSTQHSEVVIGSTLPGVTLDVTPSPDLKAGNVPDGTMLANLLISSADKSMQLFALYPDDTTFTDKKSGDKSIVASIHSEHDSTKVVTVKLGAKSLGVSVKPIDGKDYLVSGAVYQTTLNWNISASGDNSQVVAGSYPVSLTAYSYKD
ncbi:hypothetical protein FOT62_24830 [Serratia marcescens]|uniref:Uncharacterized protein n=1 Tax=Serratia marcescens TaxID=615 RepID=A0A5C7BJA1_SERMA|nr:hypothetical protein [Serratia marcescens]TXE24301.1 hypothetical protein FOT62_24830 [Serratia marcescens]TXE53292.1 hypothetical protein FOT56_27270 [Serratia marcescens]